MTLKVCLMYDLPYYSHELVLMRGLLGVHNLSYSLICILCVTYSIIIAICCMLTSSSILCVIQVWVQEMQYVFFGQAKIPDVIFN